MKVGTYFFGFLLIFSFANTAYGKIGCFPMEPFLDRNKQKIHDEKVCQSQVTRYGGKSLNTCWIASKNTCYWVANPAQCTCIQNEGLICTGQLGTKDQFGYCQWGEDSNLTGCDEWRLQWNLCKAPGHKIAHSPQNLTVDDFCSLLGGTAQGEQCVDYYNNFSKKQTCSLTDLWQNKCPLIREGS